MQISIFASCNCIGINSICVLPLVLLRYFAMLFFAFPMTVVFTIQPSLIVENAEMIKGN